MKQPLKGGHDIRIDGKPATDAEYNRIVNRPSPPVRKEKATAPLHQKGFSLLR
jgi:hypothetical protein